MDIVYLEVTLEHELTVFTGTYATGSASLIVRRQVTKILLRLLAVDDNRLAVQQHPQHTARQSAIAGQVSPRMHGTAVHAKVPLAHDTRLSRVQSQLELAFDDDSVVQRHCAVKWRRDLYCVSVAEGLMVLWCVVRLPQDRNPPCGQRCRCGSEEEAVVVKTCSVQLTRL